MYLIEDICKDSHNLGLRYKIDNECSFEYMHKSGKAICYLFFFFKMTRPPPTPPLFPPPPLSRPGAPAFPLPPVNPITPGEHPPLWGGGGGPQTPGRPVPPLSCTPRQYHWLSQAESMPLPTG